MSVQYRAISWDAQKKTYDRTLVGLVALGLGTYVGANLALEPNYTAEVLIIRASAIVAVLLLHVILCIGPLARLDRRFLPLLYNRRHLGVTMFLLALVHAALCVALYHTQGDENPFVSVFTAYGREYAIFAPRARLANFPFEPFGAAALAIFFLMAATSHDFWLRNLGASFWKMLHLGVYFAYGSVLVHVFYGALQSERSPFYIVLLWGGFALIVALHLAAAWQESRVDRRHGAAAADGFIDACATDDLSEGRGAPAIVGGERVAIYLHEGRAYAVSGVCRHQAGPIAEGRIVDGCITCPWHGWNYRPDDGVSPPPFKEVLETYNVRVEGGRVFVYPAPNAPETKCPGAPCDALPRREQSS